MNPYDLLVDLAGCLCAQIETDGSPPTCFCGVVPGDAAAQQYTGNCADKCGMAWVRGASVYPSAAVGVQDTQAGNCGTGVGMDVEVGIMRCVPFGDAAGNLPSAEALLAATQLQMTDAMTMRRALYCCEAIDNMDFILGNYTPIGPLGGLLGGTWAISVAVE